MLANKRVLQQLSLVNTYLVYLFILPPEMNDSVVLVISQVNVFSIVFYLELLSVSRILHLLSERPCKRAIQLTKVLLHEVVKPAGLGEV